MQRRHRKLTDLKMRESARAITVTDNNLACRLTAMGVLPGTEIEMIRKSPFGNAFYIKADGVRLALRQEEASQILVEL